jgi:hypothetical protein
MNDQTKIPNKPASMNYYPRAGHNVRKRTTPVIKVTETVRNKQEYSSSKRAKTTEDMIMYENREKKPLLLPIHPDMAVRHRI